MNLIAYTIQNDIINPLNVFVRDPSFCLSRFIISFSRHACHENCLIYHCPCILNSTKLTKLNSKTIAYPIINICKFNVNVIELTVKSSD
jgi:hypothetical protein